MVQSGLQPLLFVFVDGLGLAAIGSTNPLSQVATPEILRLLGGPLTLETLDRHQQDGDGEVLFLGLDACLGVEGLPQSATGQATLFTGVNAAALVGRHVPALPGASLRELIERRSVFRDFCRDGERGVFANAFTPRFLDAVARPVRRISASVLAATAGDVQLRSIDDLEAGEAVSWDITGEYLGIPLPLLRLKRVNEIEDYRGSGRRVSVIDPKDAGRNLGRIAMGQRFTLFETFLTDLAGHQRYVVNSEEALSRLDALLAGLRAYGSPELTVIVTSDHGNVEDSSGRMHTRNLVPLLGWGPNIQRFASVKSIVDVASVVRQFGSSKAVVR